jgi:hypothetical protein
MNKELKNIGHYIDLYKKNQQDNQGSSQKEKMFLRGFIKLYQIKYLFLRDCIPV